MLKEVYAKYFAKDKMFRHVFQHLEAAMIGFLVIYLFVKFQIDVKNVLTFLLFSYLPDIDGVSSIFIWTRKIPVAKKTVELIYNFEFIEALSYATINHKQLNRLLIHNFIAYAVFWAVFIFSVYNSGSKTLVIILGAILTHLTFDLLDDIKQLGHFKNWLWFIK